MASLSNGPLRGRRRGQPDIPAGRRQPASFHDAQEQREIVHDHYSELPKYIFESYIILKKTRTR
jgi:hypothetical protein